VCGQSAVFFLQSANSLVQHTDYYNLSGSRKRPLFRHFVATTKQQDMAEEIVRVCDHFQLQQRERQLAASGTYLTLNKFLSATKTHFVHIAAVYRVKGPSLFLPFSHAQTFEVYRLRMEIRHNLFHALCPLLISQKLTWDRTRASAVRNR
jgi:hypothetical protein